MVKKNNTVDSCDVQFKRVKNFLNTELKGYAQYVLRTRTMPSIMDGLKVGARKILYAAMTGDLAKKKFVKMPALIGDTLKLGYAHGDASLGNTIVNLCREDVNIYHPLEAIGQIPSLRVPKCDTAVRYLMIRKSSNLDMFMYDNELWNIQEDEGEKIEPTFFLPIIPMVLLNRTGSPGFGFSFKSFSYTIDDIIDNTITAVSTGTCQSELDEHMLTPEIHSIKEENLIYNASKQRWYNVGEYVLDEKNELLTVTDLPYNVSFEIFEKRLQQLQDKFIVKDWTNYSEGEHIKYIIKFMPLKLRSLILNKWSFFKLMMLYSRVESDILNCIDEDGESIMFFETPHALIDCFVKKRLKYYTLRKERTIKILKEKLADYQTKIKFIRLVIDGTIIIAKRKRTEIVQDLNKYDLPTSMLDMKIWRLTAEEITALEDKIVDTQNRLDYIIKTSEREMYLQDLIEFKIKYGSEIQNKSISA